MTAKKKRKTKKSPVVLIDISPDEEATMLDFIEDAYLYFMREASPEELAEKEKSIGEKAELLRKLLENPETYEKLKETDLEKLLKLYGVKDFRYEIYHTEEKGEGEEEW